MKEFYQNEIKKIKINLNEFFNKKFVNESDEYKNNKNNKNLIKDLILLIYNDVRLSDVEKQLLINDSLKLLAENTGCAEDSEIAEEILDFLFYTNKILNQNNIDFYYNHSSVKRWS